MKTIKFYEKRYIYFIISGLIFLAGIVAIFINGVQLDIQFKGGAILKYSFAGTMDHDKVASTVEDTLNRLVDVQESSDLSTNAKRLVLNLAGDYGLSADDQTKLDTALKEAFPDNSLSLQETSLVEPFFGHRFLRNGIIALVLSSVLIVLYVWLRFRRINGLSAGVMALVALFHDVLVVFFTCVIFKIPLGDSFIAVALTILGYSINDTIVIYDRIRENARLNSHQPVEELINRSISQSFTRSVYTNLCVTISILLVYIFAVAGSIDSIQSFALPMVIGSISGCYSTICIAGPLWAMWQKHKERKRDALVA